MFQEKKPLYFDISDSDVTEYGTEYIGDLPPARKALAGVISRIYCDVTQSGDPIFKVLYRASVESGYDGFTAWDNVTINKKSVFKWAPLIEAMGITVTDLATGTVTDESDTSGAGTRVIRIGDLDLSGDNTVPVFFGVKYRKFEGIQQTDVIGVRARSIVKEEVKDNFPFED